MIYVFNHSNIEGNISVYVPQTRKKYFSRASFLCPCDIYSRFIPDNNLTNDFRWSDAVWILPTLYVYLSWYVLHMPDLTSPNMAGCTLDSTAGAWPKQVKFTLPGHIFTHLGYPECSCCLECNIHSRLCRDYGLMIFD